MNILQIKISHDKTHTLHTLEIYPKYVIENLNGINLACFKANEYCLNEKQMQTKNVNIRFIKRMEMKLLSDSYKEMDYNELL